MRPRYFIFVTFHGVSPIGGLLRAGRNSEACEPDSEEEQADSEHYRVAFDKVRSKRTAEVRSTPPDFVRKHRHAVILSAAKDLCSSYVSNCYEQLRRSFASLRMTCGAIGSAGQCRGIPSDGAAPDTWHLIPDTFSL